MRKYRVALISIPFVVPVILVASLSSPSQEAQWVSPHHRSPISSVSKTMLLSNEALMPIAVFASAVLTAQAKQQQAAAAQAAAAQAAAATASTTSTTVPATTSGSTSPTSTTTAPPVSSTGNDAGWQQVAICEEGGSNSPTFGYFGIMPSTWAAYGGTAYSEYAGGSSWATQVMIGDKINGGPPWAPAGCAGAGYSGW